MKKWSRCWKASKQRRKQRKYRHSAPYHIRQKLVSSHLSKELRNQYKRRSLPLRKGDEIKVMRGSHKGRVGNVYEMDLKKLKVYVENIKAKKASGQEVSIPLDPSNAIITKLNMDDGRRLKIAKVKGV